MALPIAERPNGGPSATAAPAIPGPAPAPIDRPAPTLDVVEAEPTEPVAARTDWVRKVTTIAVVLVTLAAARGSFGHMRSLAESVGEDPAWLLPVSVDGLAVAASMTMLVRRRAGMKAGVLPWCSLLLALGVSLAANVASAEPTLTGRLVAAWPPLGLLLSYELLMQQIKAPGRPGLETVAPGASDPFGRGSGDDVLDRG